MGNLAHNPGMCPDWESNRQPLSLQASTQSTEPHQPGLACFITEKNNFKKTVFVHSFIHSKSDKRAPKSIHLMNTHHESSWFTISRSYCDIQKKWPYVWKIMVTTLTTDVNVNSSYILGTHWPAWANKQICLNSMSGWFWFGNPLWGNRPKYLKRHRTKCCPLFIYVFNNGKRAAKNPTCPTVQQVYSWEEASSGCLFDSV